MPKSKNELIAAHASAVELAKSTEQTVQALEAQLTEARAALAQQTADADRLHAEANAEEIAEAARQAKANEDRHKREHQSHCRDIGDRALARELRGEAACAHDQVKVVTIDGHTHEVTNAHELMLGSHGFAGAMMRAGSRYTTGCGLSVDAPHDELDHERFDQTKKPDCAACETAIAQMESGEAPDTRSEYLSSKEQLAFAREQNRQRMKATEPS